MHVFDYFFLGLIAFEGRQATREAYPISPHLSRLSGNEFHHR